jgi:hypothetical protein
MAVHHHSSLELDDAAFQAAFESAAIPADAFPHRAHLRTTWLYVAQLGAEAAAARVAAGIRRLAGSHGHPALYHDTLTRAWVRLVAAAMTRSSAPDFDSFLLEHPRLLDKALPLRHYSPGLLWSDDARSQWREPDLQPLP